MTPDTSTLETGNRTSTPSSSTGKPKRWKLPTFFQLSVVLVLLGILARALRYLLDFPLWGDEAFLAVNFLLRDYKGMIDPLVYGQIAPLGFMWIELAVTRAVGLSESAMRFVPFISGLLTLLLFWRFASRNLGPAIAMLAVGFLAASYYPIRHSVEVKPYSTDLLIGLIVMMSGWSVYLKPKSPLRWGFLVVLGGAAVWCSYPSIFMSAAVGVLLAYLLLRTRSPGIFAGLLVYACIVLASFIAMYIFFAKPHAEAASALKEIDMWTQAFPPLKQPWELPLWFVLIHTGNMFAYPIGGKEGASTATLLLVIVGCIVLWRTQRSAMRPVSPEGGLDIPPQSRRRALLLLLLSPLPFNFVAASLHAYPYGGTARTSLFMAPAICLLAAVGVFALIAKFLPYPHRQRGLRIIGAVLCAIAIGCMIRDVAEPYKKPETDESRRVVHSLAERVNEDDRVIVFMATEEVEHAPFIKGAKGMGAQLAFYLMQLLHVELDDFGPPPEQIQPPTNGRTWLIVFHRERKGEFFFVREQLDAYLDVMTGKFGTAEQESFSVKDSKKDKQRIDVYRFAKRGA